MAEYKHQVEPVAVADLVERYVDQELRDAAKYDNSTPLDHSGVWSLHRLAAQIYTLGHEDGERVADARHRAHEGRKREEAIRDRDA